MPPAKSAVKTGVLSKKWVRLWTSSPVLRFDQMEFVSAAHSPSSTTTRFVSFVDRVLALTSASGSIKQIHVLWTQAFDISKATTWLLHAISHNVQHLELIVSATQRRPSLLPGCLFRSPSLEHLLLQASDGWNPVVLQLPTSVSLSKLRCLRLESIVIPPRFLLELIYNSPSLKYLKISVGSQGDVHASPPNVTKLALHCEMMGALGVCSTQDGNGAKLFRILTTDEPSQCQIPHSSRGCYQGDPRLNKTQEY